MIFYTHHLTLTNCIALWTMTVLVWNPTHNVQISKSLYYSTAYLPTTFCLKLHAFFCKNCFSFSFSYSFSYLLHIHISFLANKQVIVLYVFPLLNSEKLICIYPIYIYIYINLTLTLTHLFKDMLKKTVEISKLSWCISWKWVCERILHISKTSTQLNSTQIFGFQFSVL